METVNNPTETSPIELALAEQNVTAQVIAKLKADYTGLTINGIDDKEGFEAKAKAEEEAKLKAQKEAEKKAAKTLEKEKLRKMINDVNLNLVSVHSELKTADAKDTETLISNKFISFKVWALEQIEKL